MNLSELDLPEFLLKELERQGFMTTDDMLHLGNDAILKIPGMGRAPYRRLAAALGREPFSKANATRAALE